MALPITLPELGVTVTTTPYTNPLGTDVGGVLDLVTGSGVGLTDGVADGVVDNDGQIVSTGILGTILGSPLADALDLTAGGTVNNGVAAAISGSVDGVHVTGGLGVVNNGQQGSIAGTQAGVALDVGGSISNAADGTITGGTIGAAISGTLTGAGSALDNAGLIQATGAGGTGASLDAGNLTNQAGGTIASLGLGGVGVSLARTGTVTNAGTITGTAGSGTPAVAVSLGGNGSTLVLDAGQAMNGNAVASGTGDTLELAAGPAGLPNTIADVGDTILGFGDATVDPGVAAVVTGGLSAPSGTPLAVSLGAGASLSVGGPVSAGVSIDLGNAGTKLSLGDAAGFQGTIANLGPDDALDLTGLGAGTTVSYAPGTGLTITTAAGTSTTIPVTLPAGVGLTLDPGGLGVTVGAGGTGLTVTTGTGGTGTGGTGTGGPGTGGTGTGGTGTGTGGGTTVTTGPSGGTTTVTTGPSGGGSTVTTTDPLGNSTTQTLPPGATVAQNALGDVVSIDPSVSYAGRGAFVIGGHVAGTVGVKSVTISAVIDGGAPTVLGTATVAADGSFTFLDKVGAHLQRFITATDTDGLGTSLSVESPYSLQAGMRDRPFVAQQDLYTQSGDAEVYLRNFAAGGSQVAHIFDGGQTINSDFNDVFNNGAAPDNTFVFTPGHGTDVVNLFRVGGSDHDTLSFKGTDFGNDIATVLQNTHDGKGGVVITDPTSGDTVKLTGITKQQLAAHKSDFTFHA